MSDILPFQYNTHAIRVHVDSAGQPWWVAKDVCDALGYVDHRPVLRRLDDDEKGGYSLPSLGGSQVTTCVSESGLYSLILGSKKPEAHAFKRWVTHEVIPAIRKTGQYTVTPQPVVDPNQALPQEIAARELAAIISAGQTLGVPTHIAQQEAVKAVEASTGVSFRYLLLAAPAQSVVQPEDKRLEPNDLAVKLGLPSGQALNVILEHIGWQTKVGKEWVPTVLGAPYGNCHAWTKGNKSGYNVQWNVEAVRDALQKHGLLPLTLW